jgi:hypothetical protein
MKGTSFKKFRLNKRYIYIVVRETIYMRILHCFASCNGRENPLLCHWDRRMTLHGMRLYEVN